MNADNLARCTFVLDRTTAERLSYVASRMGQSRSQLVRDVLREPVDLMHRMMVVLPEQPTDVDLRQMALIGLNGVEEVSEGLGSLRKMAQGS